MNRVGACVFIAVILVLVATAFAKSQPRSSGDHDPLKFGHLIIEGEVTGVRYETISMADLGVKPKDTFERIPFDIAIVDFAISDYLKGQTPGSTVSLLVKRNESDVFEQGSRLLVATYYNPNIGYYQIRGPSGVFMHDNGEYVCRSNNAGMSKQQIQNTIDASSLASVSLAADKILYGSIVRRDRVVHESGQETEIYKKYTLQVESVIKGKTNVTLVPFLVQTYGTPGLSESYPNPVLIDVGEKWYVFLKTGERGDYAYAGSNGLFVVDGEAVYYDKTIPYHLNKKELRAKIVESLKTKE